MLPALVKYPPLAPEPTTKSMQFVIKLFPEITIKGKSARQQIVRQLRDNLVKMLKRIDSRIEVKTAWDNLSITSPDEEHLTEQVIDLLQCTPGIANVIKVTSHTFSDLHDIYEKTAAVWGDKLKGKTFRITCKRVGQHDFSSTDIARYVGGGINQNFDTGGVDLHHPDVEVRIEVRRDTLLVVEDRYEGIGGFPLGSQDAVLSMISGGFDSAVSSYLTMARGMKTHFIFFNLGGRDHEVGVKEVAYYLWNKFGSSHRIKFITVPFEGVVDEILQNISNSQMGVILKRMFLRAASEIARQHKLEALVTGEAIAQVSSQTLANLAIIDKVTNNLVLRPLITSHKTDIIKTARAIGTEDFSASMPEYCGVISVKPTTHARQHKIDAEEANFNFEVLQQAIDNARVTSIEKLGDLRHLSDEVTLYSEIPAKAVIIDIRHPHEEELAPLELDNPVQHIPFYKLHQEGEQLAGNTHYLLYCAKGVMSKLHAQHLRDKGLGNIDVYRPEAKS